MRLQVGERLEGSGPETQPGGYVVTALVRETPWHALYLAKKIFYNFDFTAKRLREAEEVEWLDVYLRTLRYPILDDPEYVRVRRQLARAEVRTLLAGRPGRLWWEPLDLLEVENTRDPFAFSTEARREKEPIAVFAAPQALSARDWQQQILPVQSLVAVLAELLEFLQQAHRAGVILPGLDREMLRVDASDRLHYLGSDMALPQLEPLLIDPAESERWRQVYPPERFPVGFAAPECFRPDARPDARSDLFTWGCFAWSLLTGEDVVALAQQQGHPWPEFGAAHFRRVEGLLAQYPRRLVASWAAQLDVPLEALQQHWPTAMVAVLRQVLNPDRPQRPQSVAELRQWLIDLPLAAAASLVAVQTDARTAQLFVDTSLLDPSVQLRIQSNVGAAPTSVDDGTNIYDGPPRSVVQHQPLPVTFEPIHYTVFARKPQGDGVQTSPGVSAELWKATPEAIRAWAEQQALVFGETVSTPARIAQVLGGLEPGMTVAGLAASSSPIVRGWGLWRLEDALADSLPLAQGESMLWRFAADSNSANRRRAARLLWQFGGGDEARLERLFDALSQPTLDAPLVASDFLHSLGVPAERLAALLARRERGRLPNCPICAAQVRTRDLPDHLRDQHGSVLVHGEPVPVELALRRWWERVWTHGDRAAHEQLVEHYQRKTPDDWSRYLADLRQAAGAADLSEAPSLQTAAYLACVQTSPSYPRVLANLLQSPDPLLRRVGHELLAPRLAETLRGEMVTPQSLRGHLDRAIGGADGIEEKLEVLRKLPSYGIDAAVVSVCAARLRDERLVDCPECGASVQTQYLEVHLRRAHQVYEFRGWRGERQEVRARMLDAVLAAPPDIAAWRSLRSLAEDRHPEDPNRTLITWIFLHWSDLPAEARKDTLEALADLIVAVDAAEPLVPLLVAPSKNSSYESLGRRLALEVGARLEPPIREPLRQALGPLLSDREMPRRVRDQAALALLRAAGRSGQAAENVLRAYVQRTGKVRAIDKLRQLETRFGQAPAIDVVVAELEQEIRMTCPRCATQMRRREMARHLWEEHRLVLDGQLAREPWRVLQDWAVDYRLERDPQVLQRCREVATRDDPTHGLTRLYRLMLAHGVRERAMLDHLLAQAKREHVGLCPFCFEPVAVTSPTAPVLKSHRRVLEGFGYRLEVLERGLVPTLEIETPAEIFYQGREPGRTLTRTGAALVLGGLMIPLALAVLLSVRIASDAARLSLALGASLVTAGLVLLLWPPSRPPRERLLRAAWDLLVPDLFEQPLGPASCNLLAALANLTEARSPIPSRTLVSDCLDQLQAPARLQPAAAEALGALGRLLLARTAHVGGDAVALAVERSAECLTGKLPLSFLAGMLGEFAEPRARPLGRGELHRLQVLLAQAAFSTDADLDDWLALGRAFPHLRKLLDLDQRWLWHQRYQLWMRRNLKPWDKVDRVVTVFEIAERPATAERVLEHYPDALWYVPRNLIIVGTQGVWFEGVCIGSYSAGMEVSVQSGLSGRRELVVGTQTIPCDSNPREVLEDLKRWLDFYFLEYLPSLPGIGDASAESRHSMWRTVRELCPHCKKPIVPCASDLGIAVLA